MRSARAIRMKSLPDGEDGVGPGGTVGVADGADAVGLGVLVVVGDRDAVVVGVAVALAVGVAVGVVVELALGDGGTSGGRVPDTLETVMPGGT
jgi:hypothetical protein